MGVGSWTESGSAARVSKETHRLPAAHRETHLVDSILAARTGFLGRANVRLELAERVSHILGEFESDLLAG